MRGKVLALALLLSIFTAGCGYRVVGWEGGSTGNRAALWIAPVDDEGTEPLFGALLARYLSREAVDRYDMALAAREASDVSLAVKVESVLQEGVAYVAGDQVREYALTGDVSATFTKSSGQVLWRGLHIRAQRQFAAGTDVNETEANKDRTLVLLARDLSREVLSRVALARQGAPP
jgi:outer membrane lipopolysaccharide assembly protein LptE/RlpB